MEIAKDHELAVKIDSAGLLPERLRRYLASDSIDYVAIDLKTSPDRYNELGWPHSNGGSENSAEALLNTTLSLLETSGIDYEIRTTVVPGLVGIGELRIMAALAARAPKWIWQRYRPGDTLNPAWGNLNGWSDDELTSIARTFMEAGNVAVR